MRALSALLLITLLCSSPVWARGAYKWVDEAGVVHYSDRMRGSDASVINVKVDEPAESETDQAQTDGADEDGVDKQKTADPKADPNEVAKQKKIRKANCAKAKEQLAANESMSRMYRVGANGERQYLTEKERGDVIRRSLDAVKYWCD